MVGGNATMAAFDPSDWATWSAGQLAAYWMAVVAGQELLHYLIMAIASVSYQRIPESGRFLESFGWKDWAFVYINRFSVPVMTYHMFRFAWRAEGHIVWGLEEATLANTLGSLVALFMLYDLVYVPFHAFLHVRGVYKWIHKHHHSNAAPARGNLDASNTHPVEFVLGEYIHLLCVYLVPSHAATVLAFMAIGGVLASLNHTRLDIDIPLFYNVRAHDKHHHIPQSNYAQYSMWFDRLLGSYQPSTKPAINLKSA